MTEFPEGPAVETGACSPGVAAPPNVAGPSSGPRIEVPPASARAERICTVLIAALGGEGGGVLSNWLVDAAVADGRSVQATSVPGVAQRTGATTYYLEIGPRYSEAASASATDGGAPLRPSVGAGTVMALLPTPGNVDLLVASELLEAGRAAQNGLITPDRTTVIASTHRTFAIAEKSAMGDGRFDDVRVRRAVRELSRHHVFADLGAVARRAGTVLSSVLLGAVAGSGALPIPREQLRAAIERAGIAVESNLLGFDSAVELLDRRAKKEAQVASGVESLPAREAREPVVVRLPSALESRVDALPEPVRDIARLGAERTCDYQDLRYGALYLNRIEQLLGSAAGAGQQLEAREHKVANSVADASGGNDAVRTGSRLEWVSEAARQLALWMCFEDIIRVADLKTRRSRMERVRAEVRAEPGQPVVVTEFMKPGVEEWCSLLPGWLARPVLRAADRGGWRHRFKWGIRVRSSSISGFVLLRLLARLRFVRRGTSRFREEQDRIEAWLAGVAAAGDSDPALALEAAKCANLVKGYGETRERGVRSFERTMSCLAACARGSEPAASLRRLREAALADPGGAKLDAAIAALRQTVPGSGEPGNTGA